MTDIKIKELKGHTSTLFYELIDFINTQIESSDSFKIVNIEFKQRSDFNGVLKVSYIKEE